MRQIVALNPADEEAFLASHPHWTLERRVQDEQGVVWGSFRIDVAAERAEIKKYRPQVGATREIARSMNPQHHPLYAGEQAPLIERRTVRYLPRPFEREPVVVVSPPLMDVPKARIFRP